MQWTQHQVRTHIRNRLPCYAFCTNMLTYKIQNINMLSWAINLCIWSSFNCSVFQNDIDNQYFDLGRVSSEMPCEIALSSVSFVAFVAPERFPPPVRYHVALLLTRRSASVVALVTLEWLFSCMLPHHVLFQLNILNAGKLAHCASVRLFPRVGSFVLPQTAWSNWSKVALVALVWFLSSVFHNVLS